MPNLYIGSERHSEILETAVDLDAEGLGIISCLVTNRLSDFSSLISLNLSAFPHL